MQTDHRRWTSGRRQRTKTDRGRSEESRIRHSAPRPEGTVHGGTSSGTRTDKGHQASVSNRPVVTAVAW